MNGWAHDNDDETLRVENMIFEKFPQLHNMQRDDPHREHLRLRLHCAKGHLLETVVLDEDGNRHLMLRTLAEYQSGEFITTTARNATPYDHPDSMTMGRQRLRCPRGRCRYDGVFTQAQLLELFVTARLVLDMRDINLRA